RKTGTLFEVGRDGSVAQDRGGPEVVDLEQFGHERVTAGMPLALGRVDRDLQGKTTGSVRGPRTWPPAQVTAAGSASRNSGMRLNHSSKATRSSMRARLDPAQR